MPTSDFLHRLFRPDPAFVGPGRRRADWDPPLLAETLSRHLADRVIAPWFPRCVDREGFLQSFRRDWREGPVEPKTLVFQARMTWVAATATRLSLPAPFPAYARHGLAFLRERLWDPDLGGFFWSAENTEEKHAYGQAFGIMAAAGVFEATGDSDALELARNAFLWLDGHAHDPWRMGYQEALARDGTPVERTDGLDLIGTAYGRQSFNTHLHLLEALVGLFRVWPDPLVRNRLERLLHLVGDVLIQEPGFIPRFFTPAWEGVDDVASYGHDLEGASWLLQAGAALGRGDDPVLWSRARRLVDHALEHGLDPDGGGFFLEGRAGRDAHRREKVWWVQAEALATLALFHQRFRDKTSRYWNSLLGTWEFVASTMADSRFPGWYGTVLNHRRRPLDDRKGHAWKGIYHEVRGLVAAAESLRKLTPTAADDPQAAAPTRQS